MSTFTVHSTRYPNSYGLAKKILNHRSGTMYEDMYWIDPDACKVVTEVVDSTCKGKIVYPPHVSSIIEKYVGLITIHSHPSGLPPSVAAFNSNFERKYGLGVVIGHNGKVYLYNSAELINEMYYNLKLARYIQDGYNESEAREEAIRLCMESYEIYYKEVVVDE